jgi:hypothetical protein
MRPIGTISALLLVVVLTAGLGAAGEAGAKAQKKENAKQRVISQVTLQSVGPNGISGRISGDQRACRRQRQVIVYRANSEPALPGREVVASTWTRDDGSWAVPGPQGPSQYLAVVGIKHAKGIVCSSATSNPLVWG